MTLVKLKWEFSPHKGKMKCVGDGELNSRPGKNKDKNISSEHISMLMLKTSNEIGIV